ncbi:MAG: radical SAM family heme chaperone HemW [Myxococcota bacterium]
MAGPDTSVYVHFPWCLSKCPYCDFATRAVDAQEVLHERYADAVLRELEARAPALHDRRLVSVFFGGGTPSLWDPGALARVLSGVRAAFQAETEELEVTVECNPSSLDGAKAAALHRAGVNRLSLGVQSLDDAHLSHLGRRHDAATAVRAVREARSEMPRVSADLMFGMPGQTPATLAREARRLLDLGLGHVSAYALTIEPGTRFGELHRKGKLPVADDDTYADLFEALAHTFAEAGLAHYEVSNYARPGEEARHNLHYWRGGDYLGLGAAAVGCTVGTPGHARRWRNQPDPRRYMEAPVGGGPAAFEAWEEHLDAETLVREALMLGLRTREGLDLEATRVRAGADPEAPPRDAALRRATARGDLLREAGRLRVPQDRWLRLDAIVADLF